MNYYHIDTRSDQDRAAAAQAARPGHEHKFSPWRRNPQAGRVSDLFRADCACGAHQIARGSQWGTIKQDTIRVIL